MNDEALKEQIMEIVDITHSNCPYVKPCPVYNQSIRAIQEVLLQDRERAVKAGRIEELKQLITLNKTLYGVEAEMTKRANNRLAELSNPTQEKD